MTFSTNTPVDAKAWLEEVSIDNHCCTVAPFAGELFALVSSAECTPQADDARHLLMLDALTAHFEAQSEGIDAAAKIAVLAALRADAVTLFAPRLLACAPLALHLRADTWSLLCTAAAALPHADVLDRYPPESLTPRLFWRTLILLTRVTSAGFDSGIFDLQFAVLRNIATQVTTSDEGWAMLTPFMSEERWRLRNLSLLWTFLGSTKTKHVWPDTWRCAMDTLADVHQTPSPSTIYDSFRVLDELNYSALTSVAWTAAVRMVLDAKAATNTGSALEGALTMYLARLQAEAPAEQRAARAVWLEMDRTLGSPPPSPLIANPSAPYEPPPTPDGDERKAEKHIENVKN